MDRQNLKLMNKLPEKLKTRQGRECPVAAHLTLGKTVMVLSLDLTQIHTNSLMAVWGNSVSGSFLFPFLQATRFSKTAALRSSQDKPAASECAGRAKRHETAGHS